MISNDMVLNTSAFIMLFFLLAWGACFLVFVYKRLGVQKVDNKVWNPWSNGFKDYQNSRMPSIIEPPKVNHLPAIAGATAGGYLSERAGKVGEDYAKEKLK